ncbi:MAG TPA: GvpL/GvpF family gas vesicle protein [Pseudonocardiaceae bacterium]|nr:GvpL/GvpF family gas vesicle protein [Pseudonocardiaceae bacterium]
MTEQTGVWLYAVTRERDGWDGLAGVADAAVRPIAGAGLVALGSTVDLASYGEAALKRNLEDLDWLAATARAHDQVVRAAAQRGVTVPLRLATVYRNDDRVRAMLDESGAEFEETLHRFEGRAEWGVKGYVEATPRPTLPAPTSGTDYLHRRRAQLAKGNHAGQDALRVHETLSSLAVAARKHPLQDARLTGISAQMVLNSTYLVDDERVAEFHRLVTEQGNAGIRLDLTGPWPPYSFSRNDFREALQ